MPEDNAVLNQEPSNTETETNTQTNTEEAGKPRPLSLLASELYGESEVPEEKKAAKPADDPSEEKVDPAKPAEQPEEPKGEEPKEPGKEEPEEVPISSFQELVDHYELDWEWFKGLKLPVNVDGQTAETTFSELVKSYRTDQAAERLLTEAKEKAKAQNQELAQQSQSLQAQFATAAGLISNAEKLLDADSQSIDWNQLRKDDPAEYSARKAEHAERKQIIDNMKREALETYQKSVLEQNQKAQEQLRAALETERNALLDKLKEWRDPEKAKAGQIELGEYLKTQGFTDQDISQAYDHRMILMARKAMLYDKGQNKVSTALKKVAKVPKVLKPGSPQPKAKPENRDAAEILYPGMYPEKRRTN